MQPCLENFLWHGFSNNLLWSPQRFSQLEQAWKSLVFCRKLINLWAEEPGAHFDLWVLDVFSGWGKERTHWPQQEFPQLHTGDFVWSIKNQSHRITHWVGTLNLTQSHPWHGQGPSIAQGVRFWFPNWLSPHLPPFPNARWDVQHRAVSWLPWNVTGSCWRSLKMSLGSQRDELDILSGESTHPRLLMNPL